MSSCVGMGGDIAPAVLAAPVVVGGAVVVAGAIVAVGAAAGTGWLLYKGGKLLVEGNIALDNKIKETIKNKAEALENRKKVARSAHGKLVEACEKVISKLEEEIETAGELDKSDIREQIKELTDFCKKGLPDDAEQIESITSFGYLMLDKAVRKHEHIKSIRMSSKDNSLSLAELMEALRITVGAMDIKATNGTDVIAPDPDVLERKKLNAEFHTIADEIIEALIKVETLSASVGLNDAGSTWYHSCFNGVDKQIELMCSPTVTNSELRDGIETLKASLKQYKVMSPLIEKQLREMNIYYKVYVDASIALGEKPVSLKSFKNAEEIEAELRRLDGRMARAQECNDIFHKLGDDKAAYLCFACDMELKALGYGVYSHEAVKKLAEQIPEHAVIGDKKMPFYEWDEEELTQLYEIASKCSLQVIVNKEDGSISMKTFSDDAGEKVVEEQKLHCGQLKVLIERLRKNWFISYDMEETESPEVITTAFEWRKSADNAWSRRGKKTEADRRTKKTSQNKKYIDE